jgi:hypothetical protein
VHSRLSPNRFGTDQVFVGSFLDSDDGAIILGPGRILRLPSMTTSIFDAMSDKEHYHA